ncbi:SusD/RagB family nutrient-binding outer membrane lipoprotein [Pedobacter namyangjuensis]|uniref:SusD/RagB family nutrient-binding outer membrane lipoprotein n=1 Tax=Pedobacter namyangjuensis TaxID=600626 RepID=UPI000DE1DACF|nr:SusD/RagB family nutrient-binding outer membrane lipoprotein [Pedobacter namyangjuensis]
MKRILNISIILLLVVGFSSCKKDYLDINDNPNSATSSTPQLVLPAVLNNMGGNYLTYFSYGGYMVGYMANAGGYSFVGSATITYNYNNNSNTGLFTAAYSDLRSLQYIIKSTTDQPQYVLYNSVARILKSYYYQLLVDEYGNVPYSEALLGADNVTPHYDDAATIYQDLIKQIDESILQLRTFGSSSSVTALGTSDIVFGGNTTKWIQFANNIKLRILTRAQNSSLTSFVNNAFGTFSAEGFMLDDVLIQPGYISTAATQNPLWNSYQSTYTGASVAQSVIPSTWIHSFYNGTKLSDAGRGTLIYRAFSGNPVRGQLGVESNPVWGSAPNWYVGTGTGTASTEARGLLKSRVMGLLFFSAAETHFLLAEAALKGHVLSGSASANFESGIKASYNYLNKSGTTTTSSTTAVLDAYLNTYKTNNATSYLVNYNLATTDAERLEAIITQKYIALNFVNGFEAWQEYKRTGYPRVSGTAATTTFASTQSVGSTPDRLPVRSLYPTTEYNLNPNVPPVASIDAFTTKIFWDNN